MIIAKIHSNDGKMILALCDENLIGNTYEEEDKILDLSSNFYKGKEATDDIVKRLIQQSYMINAVGNEVIGLLKKLSILEENKEIKISGIPYIQIVNTNMEN